MNDLFGHPILRPDPLPPSVKKRSYQPNGYAAPPGSGPAGETCKTCEHYARRQYAKVYRKCALLKAHWTNGPGTDIKASSPACARWEKPTP